MRAIARLSLNSIPREQYDKDGYFHADSLGLATIAFNHRLVKKEEAPKTYNDLLDPKWKGDLTIDLEPERMLTAWLLAWGEPKTQEFVQKLLANGTTVRRGHTLQAQLCAPESSKLPSRFIPTRSCE